MTEPAALLYSVQVCELGPVLKFVHTHRSTLCRARVVMSSSAVWHVGCSLDPSSQHVATSFLAPSQPDSDNWAAVLLRTLVSHHRHHHNIYSIQRLQGRKKR